MASIGPNSVSVQQNNTSVGTTAWDLSTSNSFTQDDNGPAVFSVSSGTSNRLIARNVGFSVPSGATIDGIEVVIRSNYVASAGTSYVKLWNGNSATADNSIGTEKTFTPNPDSLTNITLGSPTDLWGATLTDTIVNGSDFGVALWKSYTSMSAWFVDHIQIKVYYTESSGETASVSITTTNPTISGSLTNPIVADVSITTTNPTISGSLTNSADPTPSFDSGAFDNSAFFTGDAPHTVSINITTVNPTVSANVSALSTATVSITTVNPTVSANISEASTFNAAVNITTVNPTVSATVSALSTASVSLTTLNPTISANATVAITNGYYVIWLGL